MEEISVQIKAIQEKLQVLLRQQQLLQKENQKLKKDLEKMQTEKLQKESDLEGMIQQLESVKMGGSQWSPADKILMEKRIDGYLKEIEKCLLLLNA
jgi:negative regulator of genetic competence, sporulation and motility